MWSVRQLGYENMFSKLSDSFKQGFKYFFVAAVSVTWATRGRTCWGSPSTTCCTPTACGSSSPSTGSVGRYNSHQDAGKGDRRSMRNCVQRTLIRLLFPFKFCLNLTRRRDHFKCALIASIHYTITITSSSSLEQPLASKA